jgi:hypothetical protein
MINSSVFVEKTYKNKSIKNIIGSRNRIAISAEKKLEDIDQPQALNLLLLFH